MGSVRFALRAELRQGLLGMLGLALLLGLIGGVVLTAAAGARRTDTAYPRLLRWGNAAQVEIIPNGNGPFPGYFAALRRLPQVASMSAASLYDMVLPVRHGLPLTPVETLVQCRRQPRRHGGPRQDRQGPALQSTGRRPGHDRPAAG